MPTAGSRPALGFDVTAFLSQQPGYQPGQTLSRDAVKGLATRLLSDPNSIQSPFRDRILNVARTVAADNFNFVFRLDGNATDLSETDLTFAMSRDGRDIDLSQADLGLPPPNGSSWGDTTEAPEGSLLNQIRTGMIYPNGSAESAFARLDIAPWVVPQMLQELQQPATPLTAAQQQQAVDVLANAGIFDQNNQANGLAAFLQANAGTPLGISLQNSIRTQWGIDPTTGQSLYRNDAAYGVEAQAIEQLLQGMGTTPPVTTIASQPTV